ncbi:MAG: DUF3823 domain-containing protein [Chitinophagaceae bacterium]|nr:DUF3823 domain-containing protein [Chitinophagaceae bacterium]
MKLSKYIFSSVLAGMLLTACTRDNYDAPTASIFGKLIDKETGEPVEQDIIRGTQIEYQEGRFTTNQYMVVKADGSFRNDLMFEGTYRMAPVRGNFEPLEVQEIKVAGPTEHDFLVTPFLRIKNVNIFKNGNKVRALFRIEQTGYDNVLKVGLFAGVDKAVGANVFQSGVEVPVGSQVSPTQNFVVEMDIANNPQIKAGKTYYFRVGAVIDAPEARFNYAPAVELSF